jgi:hypothetical protein
VRLAATECLVRGVTQAWERGLAEQHPIAGFVRANTRTLYRTAFMLAGNAHAAEELLQDTLAILYPKWDRVTAADSPVAYVLLRPGRGRHRRRAGLPPGDGPQPGPSWIFLPAIPVGRSVTVTLNILRSVSTRPTGITVSANVGTGNQSAPVSFVLG